MLSIVIPVFRNEKNIDRLVQELERLTTLAPLPIEVVFVVDGSPDRSLELLQRALLGASFFSVLVSLSRNFGAFNAVRCGLEVASGDYFAMLAADLQEPADLIALFFWLGFRRAFVPYHRQRRHDGRSAWTLAKKLRYGLDSLFSFTDVPIRLLLALGILGSTVAVVFAALLLSASLSGRITVPGYAPTVLIVTFFGSITSLGLGIVGQYVWLILQTTRGRPGYLIDRVENFQIERMMRSTGVASRR